MDVILTYTTLPDTSNYQQQSGDLVITNVGFPGHFWLDIEVTVTEVTGPTIATVQSGRGMLNTQRLDYEERFRRDQANCQAALRIRVDNIKSFHYINILLTFRTRRPRL